MADAHCGAADHVRHGHADELSRLYPGGQDAQECADRSRVPVRIDADAGRNTGSVVQVPTRDRCRCHLDRLLFQRFGKQRAHLFGQGNLALSVTITAAATAMAPLMTPLLMKLLAGRLISVDAAKMSFEIMKLVIVPILAAFVHDWLTNSSPRVRRIVLTLAAVGIAWLVFLVGGGWSWVTSQLPGQSEAMIGLASMPGFLAAAFVFGTSYHYSVVRLPSIEKWMPTVSMFGIVYFTLVATAKGRDHLLDVGAWLLLSTFLHNVLGYILGYLGARLFGMNERDARTVAIEVGTQNGSMGVGIATAMNKVETVGLAAIVFAPMMNVTGSIIANYWRQQDELAESRAADLTKDLATENNSSICNVSSALWH